MTDLSALEAAMQQLEKFFALSKQDLHDHTLQQASQTACIKAFEYTYELSHKTLKRFLKERESNKEEFENFFFQDLIRVGFEKGLLKSSWKMWKTFRDARNETSHSYREDYLTKILLIIPSFLLEVHFLLDQLHEHQNKN